LWVFFPSFNAVFGPQGTQNMIILNTVAALAASTVMSFLLTKFTSSKFEIDTVRNAALAAGVMVGSAVNILIYWYIALLLGMFAGAIVVIGRMWLQPILDQRFTFKDTRGVLYLHGITGFLGAISAIIGVAVAKRDAGPAGTNKLVEGINFQQIFAKEHHEQELRLLAALAVSIGLGIIFGFVAGLIIKFFRPFKIEEPHFTDHREFYSAGDFPTFAIRNKAKPGRAAKG